MGNRKGIVIMLIGLLLMAAALYRVMENDRDEAEAARESDQILAELQSIMWENTQTVGRGENSAYSANVGVGNPLGGETTVVVKTPAPVGRDFVLPTPLATEAPIFIENPDMDMPTLNMNGNTYIGTLEVPSKGLILPVMSEWSYPNLKKAPCLYSGSIYAGNAVIAAHNYAGHFGRLAKLSPADTVYFTDVDGNRFSYEVVLEEVLEPTSVEEMTANVDKPLTVSILGCPLNGIGEGENSDLGIAGGKEKSVILKDGKIFKTVNSKDLLTEFEKLLQEKLK